MDATRVHIEDCPPLDTFVVKTRNTTYDLVVVSGPDGHVLIRGGRYFPDFRRAQLVGATEGSHTLRLLSVDIGLCLELYVDSRSIVTSPVVEISRPTPEYH